MKEFRYQLHCHTAPCSKCGAITPYDLVHSLYEGGYSGAAVTNHFFNGNSGIDRDFPWKKFVSCYEKDYLECRKFAAPLGIDILFGIEEHMGNGQEILCYGITPEMLYVHPELKNNSLELWYDTLSPLGVIIVQAHPFRVRSYVSEVGLFPSEFIHGIEVYNFGNSEEENLQAEAAFSDNPHFITTSGADAHLPHVLCHAGIISKERISSERKLAEILITQQYSLIKE